MSFDDFWAAYPKRKGSNPKYPASLKFATAVKNGADPAHIIGSAARYREELQKQGKDDTEFVCMATTWLNQRRWLDYAPCSVEKAKAMDEVMLTKGYKWNGERWEKQDVSTSHPH